MFEALTLYKLIVLYMLDNSSAPLENAQISDELVLRTMIIDIIKNNEEQRIAYLNGRTNLFDYFVGQVMKQTKGKANPVMTKQILKEELEK